jgi:1-deoxy-D-xylulose-5-phosphate reductoisomerase
VEFADGSVKAQLGTPDMRTPIAYALSFPDRLPLPESSPRLSPADAPALSFAHVDHERYPALRLALDAMAAGGTALCTVNAANEVAVAAFLAGRIAFTDIVRVIEATLRCTENIRKPTLDDLVACNAEARRIAGETINSLF